MRALITAGVPKSLWGFAATHATQLHNIGQKRDDNRQLYIPYEKVHGYDFDISKFRIFDFQVFWARNRSLSTILQF